MLRSLAPLGLGLAAGLAALGATRLAAPAPSPAQDLHAHAHAGCPGCKPEAPVGITLLPGDLRGGSAAIELDLEGHIDLVGLRVEASGRGGAEVRSIELSGEGPLTRGEHRRGTVFADVLGAGRLELTVVGTIADPEGEGGLSEVRAKRYVDYGDTSFLNAQPEGTLSVLEGETVRILPSVHRPSAATPLGGER